MNEVTAVTWERLFSDHAAIYDGVRELTIRIQAAKRSEENAQLKQQLKEMRVKAHRLIGDLDRHGEWEEQELFPRLTDPEDTQENHILITSLWMLEKEHELVHEYFESFFSGLNQWPQEPGAAHLERTLDYLAHACRLVQEHLMMEEEILEPLKLSRRKAVVQM